MQCNFIKEIHYCRFALKQVSCLTQHTLSIDKAILAMTYYHLVIARNEQSK
ncbi:hypothetical protein [Helicobacter rodentium]|uniref:hypothetical protein n=1 Tax=Helicobacter rodentium TaxID=59617 RepID=UPI0025A4CC6A|nr:hypothetical protein [Helicobacter rodentium]